MKNSVKKTANYNGRFVSHVKTTNSPLGGTKGAVDLGLQEVTF
jgi:hypothetical protein